MPNPLEHVITCPLCQQSLKMGREAAKGDRARQRFLQSHLDDCGG